MTSSSLPDASTRSLSAAPVPRAGCPRLVAMLLGALVAIAIGFAPAVASAQDADAAATARRHWQTCKALLEGGDACEALNACDAGLAAAPTNTALQKLRETALSRCSSKPARTGKRDKDRDGVPNGEDRCENEPEDIDGFEDDDGCPDADNDGDGVADDADQCPFAKEDLDTFEDEDGCPDTDNDNDGIADADDQCPLDREDQDGIEDDDGCPDDDNDNDGIADLEDTCPNQGEDQDGFEDEDGCPDLDNDNDGLADLEDQCPMQAEDADAFEDEDGCPDDDNDLDGLADNDDECPLAAEDIDGWNDGDGCPEDDDPMALSTWGWIVGGVGLAASGTSLGLHLAAEAKRDTVRDASTDAFGITSEVKQTEVAGIEDDANTLDTVSVITLGVGGALLVTGVALIIVDYTGDDGPAEESGTTSLAPWTTGRDGGVVLRTVW